MLVEQFTMLLSVETRESICRIKNLENIISLVLELFSALLLAAIKITWFDGKNLRSLGNDGKILGKVASSAVNYQVR